MQKLMKEYLNELKKQQKRRRKVSIAVVLLVTLVVGTVTNGLTRYGSAMTGDVKCGLEEHQHTNECYQDVLICGYGEDEETLPEDSAISDATANTEESSTSEVTIESEESNKSDTSTMPEEKTKTTEKTLSCGQEESKGHQHTESCYEEELVLDCTQEENKGHQHTEDCYEEESILDCAQEESEGHQHDDSCYETESILDCDQEEDEEHTHDDNCYTSESVLTCEQEESEGHQHGDGCYKTESTLKCEQEENEGHQHNDDCYKIESILKCGQEEGEGHTHNNNCYTIETVTEDTKSSEPTIPEDNKPDTSTSEEEIDSTEHVHTQECYEQQLVCELEEHTHTDDCLIDHNADIEDASDWEAQYANVEWTDAWGEDLVIAAKIQLDYQESLDNYQVADDGSHKGYSRYGEFSGEPYADWDAAFVNFCIHYAGLPDEELFPNKTDTHEWYEAFVEADEKNSDYLTSSKDYIPVPGDLIFFDSKEEEDKERRMGIISSYEEENETEDGPKLKVIEGNSDDKVKENIYAVDDSEIAEYLKITEMEMAYKNRLSEEEQAQVDAVIALIEALPTMEEIAARFAELEEAEDEEGYATYYQELYAQVMAAQEAYNALTDAQKEAVTNAEILKQFEWLLSGTLEEGDSVWDMMGPDEAYVNEIKVTGIATGSAPFDETEGRGNDTTAEDKLVRTFDTVTYNFNVNMKSWDTSKSYSQARVKMEFVLPLSEREAVFEQTAMAWMDQTEDYKPVVTIENRIIDGVEKECQVLTAYKLLLPSEGNHSVVPGDFGENLTIFVRSMKNGATFHPIISAAMEGGAWDEPCDKEEHKIDGEPAIEKKSVTADDVEVTAAPKYNIQVDGGSSYADDFNFQGDEAWMEQYKDVAANTDIVKPLPGRAMKLGITLQLYNDNASKGLKGIELPDGSDITFDLKLSSIYTINTPKENSNYQTGQEITDTSYAPLLWSYNEVDWKKYGSQNKDGRQIDDRLKATPYAPYNSGSGSNACYNGGSWMATQEGDTVHITVSGYEIDTQKMPTLNADEGIYITYGANVGCFSSGEIWLIQPFNVKEGNGTKPNYDIVETYGQGFFATTAEASNLQLITIGGEKLVQGENGFQQMVKEDDRETGTLELTLGGYLQNRVRYADGTSFELGCGILDNRDGRDYAAIGTELNLMGGLSYHPNRVEENQMYLGTTLLKFYGTALELTKEEWFLHLEGGAALNGHDDTEIKEAEKNVRFYYATKKDGNDWVSDKELKTTYEDDLVFYDSLDKIPVGKTCVGMLISFIGPGANVTANDPYYRCYHKATVRDNMDLAGQTFMLASTSRVWTKEMFEKAGISLNDINLQKNPELNIPSLILEDRLWNCGHYTSANINGSVFYEKETYRSDGSGIEGTHNSDWYHWGDTLLVIGYKTKITKNLLQKDENGEEKKTFNLDADQRVADFKLQPTTYYDSPGSFGNTANITIVDTLPKHMTYKPGSAYFGGAYEQTSAWGGKKGNIIRDETEGASFPEPVLTEPTVTNNADGSQTLTWVVKDVTIGEPMAPIFYSTDIGVKGNPEQDVPTGTTDLQNVVYITTPRDTRDPVTTAEKHAEAGITVTRGSASSFGKYTKQKVVDEDGTIDYVVYFNNNAETACMVRIMDTMPMNEVNGSHFTGTYTFAEWKLDTTKCDASKLKIYYTFDTQYKDKTIQNITQEEIEKWKQAPIDSNGNILIPTETDGATDEQPYPVAWAVIGGLESGRSVSIDLKIQLSPESSDKDKNEYNYFVNRLSSGDTTITTETPTVRRTLEGLTWMDYNRDGIQDEPQTETRISGVRVELLKLKENGNPEDENSYENVYYPNTDTSDESNKIVIETGQQISVRAKDGSEATNYEQGRYKFTDLSAGTFAVRFTDGSGETKITELNATKPDCGMDDTIDSDGIPVYDENDDEKLLRTVILNLEMPKAEDMSVSLFESKNHDSGFYPDTLMKIQKVDKSGEKTLEGAIFTIQDSKGQSLSFTYKEGKGYIAYLEEVDTTLIGKYYIAFAANPEYVIGITGDWNGAMPVLQKRTGNALQLFEVVEHGGDLKSFRNVGSDKWLDLADGNKRDGAKIHVWSNEVPNANQKWYVTDAGAGSYIWPSTANHADEWRIDLSGGNPSEGETIHLWSSNSSDAQKWILIPASGSESKDEVETQTDLRVDNDGSLTIHNLIPGDYTLTEIKSPLGYSLLREPVKFTLNTDNSITVESNMASVREEEDNKVTLKVKNEELYELPKTGGIGIYWYTISGTLLMLAGMLVLYKKKYARRC